MTLHLYWCIPRNKLGILNTSSLSVIFYEPRAHNLMITTPYQGHHGAVGKYEGRIANMKIKYGVGSIGCVVHRSLDVRNRVYSRRWSHQELINNTNIPKWKYILLTTSRGGCARAASLFEEFPVAAHYVKDVNLIVNVLFSCKVRNLLVVTCMYIFRN